MDELDSLLVDLGTRKDTSMQNRKTRPPTSRVDLNELASLMEVLAEKPPSSPGTNHNATPIGGGGHQQQMQHQSVDPYRNSSLDFNPNSRPVSSAFLGGPPSGPSPSSSGRKDTSVDDLDALMESLSSTASPSINSSSSSASASASRGQPGGTVGKQLGSSFFAFAEPQVDNSVIASPNYNSARPVSGYPVADLYNAQLPPVSQSPAPSPAYQPRPVSNVYGNNNPETSYSPSVSRPLTQNIPREEVQAGAYGGYNPPSSVPSYTSSGNRASGNYNSNPSPNVSRNTTKQPDDLDDLLNNLSSQMDSNTLSGSSSNLMRPPSTYSPSVPNHSHGGSGGYNPSASMGNMAMGSMGMAGMPSSTGGAPKGTCKACQQTIYGEVVQALGSQYHPEHFSCGACRSPIGTGLFYDYNGLPTCDRCYKEQACPKCAHCDKAILDRCVTAIGKKWHAEHFICTQCLRPFEGGVFFERDGRPYCEADFYNVFAPKCAGCNESVRGDCITALGSQWHPEHFECNYCQKSLVNSTFFEFGGKPFCEAHYHMQTGSTCSGCGKAITGRSVTALGKKWHPEHFVCAFCMNPLSGGSYTEHNTKAYCKECHCKLFGQ